MAKALITGSARQDRGIGADRAVHLSEGRRPTVVVAHDYLTQRGGAERVARELAAALRAERLVTSAYDPRARSTISRTSRFSARS